MVYLLGAVGLVVLALAAYGLLTLLGVVNPRERDPDDELRRAITRRYWWRIGLAVHTVFFLFSMGALWIDAPLATATLLLTAVWGSVLVTHYLFAWFAEFGERAIARELERERAELLDKAKRVDAYLTDDGEISDEPLPDSADEDHLSEAILRQRAGRGS